MQTATVIMKDMLLMVPRIHMDSKEFAYLETKLETIAMFQPVFYRPWSCNGIVWPRFHLDQVIFKIRTNIRKKGLVNLQEKSCSTMQRSVDPFLRLSNEEQSQHFSFNLVLRAENRSFDVIFLVS